jgi:hypothetical protein
VDDVAPARTDRPAVVPAAVRAVEAPQEPALAPSPPDNTRRLALTEGLTIGALTLAGYLCAFAYESGYIARFSVPAWVIRVDLMHVIATTAMVAAAVLTFAAVPRGLPRRPPAVLVYHVWEPLWAFALGTFLLWQTQWTLGWHLLIPSLVALLLFTHAVNTFLDGVLRPLRRYNDLPTVWDRWRQGARDKAGREAPSSVWDAVLSGRTFDPSRPLVAVAFLVYVCGPLVFRGIGVHRSVRQESYAVYEDKAPCVAVREYGDRILCVDVDTAQRRTLGSFRLLSVTSDSARFAVRVLGRLQTMPDNRPAKAFAPTPKVGRP